MIKSQMRRTKEAVCSFLIADKNMSTEVSGKQNMFSVLPIIGGDYAYTKAMNYFAYKAVAEATTDLLKIRLSAKFYNCYF